jgi:hypothetical protein
MIVDDEVRDIIGQATARARQRNITPWVAPPGYFPEPKEILHVRCVHCFRPLQRPREFIEKANRRDGFVACDSRCRVEQIRKDERLLLVRSK